MCRRPEMPIRTLLAGTLMFVMPGSGWDALDARQAVGTPGADLVFTPPGLAPATADPTKVAPGEIHVPAGTGDFRYSLCTRQVLTPADPSPPCNRQTVGQTHLGPIVRGGTQASYVFAVPHGEALPDGVSLDTNGVLTVREGARLAQTELRLCVRQLNVNDACEPIGINRAPAQAARPAAEPSRQGGISPAVIGATIGAGVATGLLLNEVAKAAAESASGSCYSTRSCIVNAFGGGCSCSGTVDGPCDFSGTPGGVGASCAGGTPCRAGLQCTNGRCEDPRSASARCP